VVPAAMPVTAPVADTVPVAGALLVQLPPGVTSASRIVAPTHTDEGPVTAGGPALTVSVFVTVQLVPPREYVIVATPVVTPVTLPDEVPIVMAPLVVLQEPPGAISLKTDGSPTHTVAGPRMGPGAGLTVTTVVI